MEKVKEHCGAFFKQLQGVMPENAYTELQVFGYLAGGAIRSLLLKEPIKDYDIFFTNSHSADTVARHLDEMIEASTKGDIPQVLFKRNFNTENAHSFYFTLDGVKVQVQFVKKFYGDPSVVVGRFDYTHSMAFYAPYFDYLYVSPQTLDALETRKLVFNPECYSPTHSAGRAAKFIKHGWTIDKESLQLMAYAVGKEALTIVDEAYTMNYPTVEKFKSTMRSGGVY